MPSSGGGNNSGGWGGNLIYNASNFLVGMGDTISLGGTKAIRDMWNDDVFHSDDPVPYSSGSYFGGQVAGYALDIALGAGVSARAAGWTSKIAIHGAHHAFGSLGKLSHIQTTIWRIGSKGSGFNFRMPLPWR